MYQTTLGSQKTVPWAFAIFAAVAGVFLALSLGAPSSASAQSDNITKAADRSTAELGDFIIYYLNYRCPALETSDCENVVIEDVLPTGTEYVTGAGTADIPNVSHSGGTVTFTGAALAPGSTGQVTLTVRVVAPSWPGDVLTNDATITWDGNPTETSDPVDVTVTGNTPTPTPTPVPVPWTIDKTAQDTTAPNNSREFWYTVNIIAGTGDLTTVSVVDTLPAGAVYVGSSCSDSCVYNAGANTLTWTFANLTGNETVNYAVTYDHNTAGNAAGQTKTNTAALSGDWSDDGSGVGPIDDDSVTITLRLPNDDFWAGKYANSTRDRDWAWSDDDEVTLDEEVRWQLDWWNSSDRAMTNLVIEDNFPPEFTFTQFQTGRSDDAATGFDIEIEIDDTSWVSIPQPPFDGTVNDDQTITMADLEAAMAELTGTEAVTGIRWSYATVPWPFNDDANPVIFGVYSAPAAEVGDAPENCVRVTADVFEIDGTPETIDQTRCDNHEIREPWAKLDPSKSTVTGDIYKGGVSTFRIDIENHSTAALDLVDPVLADLLPEGFTYIDGSFAFDTNDVGALAPIITVVPDANGTQDLVRFSFTGASAITLAPGESFSFTIDTQVDTDIAPGSYENHIYAIPNVATSEYSCYADGEALESDLGVDLNGDGDTDDTLCVEDAWQDVEDFPAGTTAQLDSFKWVKGNSGIQDPGAGDPTDTAACEITGDGYTRTTCVAVSTQGGIADYRLIVENSGNVNMTDIMIVDILPYIGDTGVLLTDDDRLTDWRPIYVGPVVSSNPGVTTYYSTSNNPCRPEVDGPNNQGVDCEDPAWSATVPTDLTSVESIKIDFNDLVLAPGESVQLDWPMRVPVGTPTDLIAWNSFAYTSTRADIGIELLASEPPKVGIVTVPPNPNEYGNYVWLDDNKDGIQNEPIGNGLNGVRVELFLDDGDGVRDTGTDTSVGWTLTGNNFAGEPGYYLFPDLPDGDYYAVFTAPAGYTITEMDASGDLGADDESDHENDSDVNPATGMTPITTLGAPTFPVEEEQDYSWDLGLYLGAADPVYDLALIKTHDADAGPFNLNDNVVFTITVFNQGNQPAASIGVTDYIPAAMSYSATNSTPDGTVIKTSNNADATITNNGDGTFAIDALGPYDNVSFDIELTIDSVPGTTITNWAEISADDGDDVDSTPDATNFNQDGETDDLDDDNVTNEDGNNGGDEDDHDPEQIEMDALFSIGNQVWQDNNNNGLIDGGEPLLEGITVELWSDDDGDGVGDALLETQQTVADGLYLFDLLIPGKYVVSIPATNWDDAGTPGPLAGFRSSTGDTQTEGDNNDNGIDPTNPGEAVWSGSIDLGTDEPTGEDPDNDSVTPDNQENLTIDFGFYYNFDLALDKVLKTTGTIIPGATVEFTVSVYNQGDVDAYDIDVQDYVPTGMTYNDAGSTATGNLTSTNAATIGFTNNADGTFTIDELASGDSVSFDIALDLAADFQPRIITNWAEISDASDEDGGATALDIDSTPDATNFNQDGETDDLDDDNVIDENGKADGDEDDHDPAPVTVTQTFDLALQKELTSTGPFSPNDAVVFAITIYNQGTLDAYDIDVADYIPTGMSYSATNSTATGTLTTADTATVGFTNNGDGTFTIDELAHQDSVSFDIELTIASDFAQTTLTNWAEISDASETDGGPTATDVDSTPDADNFNQDGETDDLDDDNVVDEDGKNGGDEDDHDPAQLTVTRFDLALEKVLSTAGTVIQGETVVFTITVHNQGDVTAYDIDVTDYIPTDMVYSAAGSTATGDLTTTGTATTGFTNNGDGTFTIDELAAGDDVSFDIALTVDPDFQGTLITNWAEITDGSDVDGGANRVDIDSTPDSTNFNQDGETDDLDDDNVVDEDGKNGGDEDDHDPAPVTITQTFDLALQKVVTSEGPFSPQDAVVFTVTVYNQGTLNAYDIDIADYIPTGMSYSATNSTATGALTTTLAETANFTNNGDGTFTLDYLKHGDDVSFDIEMTIAADFGESTITNWAEISDAAGAPDGPTATDIDSTPDAENFNQDGETDDLDDDNVVDEDGKNGGDEDDHDPAQIEVTRFDLALKKELVTEGQISRGDAVTFAITIYNQGDVDAYDITTVDYVPADMTFTGSNAADVTTSANAAATVVTDNGDGTFEIDTIAVGDSVTFNVILTIDPSFDGTSITNWAEITGGSDEIDGDPRVDIDSTPDSENFNQDGETDDLDDDDVIDEDGKNDGDEDDHDPAPVTVTPIYSLGNQVWEDTNNNGLIDAGEPLLEGIWVELWQDADADGQPDDINDDGTIDDADMLAMDTTDADGLYLFEDLLAGNYLVSIPAIEWVDENGDNGPLAGLVSSTGDDQTDTDNNDNGIDPANPGEDVWSDTVVLGDGEPTGEDPDNDPVAPDLHENLTVDFGFTPTYSIGNQVWLDTNDDGSIDTDESPIANIWVELWQDADADGQPDDLNDDGVIDDSDMLAMDTTDADGLYLFDNLLPGDYLVSIPAVEWEEADGTPGPLAGHRSSTGDSQADVDNNDNGIDPASIGEDVWSATLTLGDTEPTGENPDNDTVTRDENENLTADFGFVPVYSLGNQVWEDSNNNGVVDAGEPLLADIWVELFADEDGDGLPDDLNADGIIDDDDMIEMATTDADGFYLFDELDAGQYVIVIPAVEWEDDGPLDGYSSSTGDDQTTLDNNDNGIDPAEHGADVVSGTIILGNDEPTGEDPDNDLVTPDAQEDLTIDFGFYYNFDLALKKELVSSGEINPGDDVTFRITIENQGVVDAQSINVMDHAPAELIYKSSNAADVTTTAEGATVAITDNGADSAGDMSFSVDALAAGDSVALEVTFTIDEEFTGTSITNLAEITAADDDDDPDNTPPVDIDSVPDTDPENDGDPKDDVTDEDGKNGGDEDDHDPEEIVLKIPLFDLALDKKLAAGQDSFAPGGDAIFEITVYNQGQKDAYRIGVTDYAPAGLSYSSSDATSISTTDDGNDVVVTDNGDGTFSIDNLKVDDAVTITVTMKIGDNVSGELINYAEISEADDDTKTDDAPPTDFDSTPDSENQNTPGEDADLVDDAIDENGREGGDEDDHDPASLTIVELAEIGDYVWYDNNYDGVQQTDEPGVEGVTVKLYDEDDTLVGTTKTDSTGKYIFEDLAPGVYYIEFDVNTLPDGYTPTTQNTGSDDAADSDGDPNTGRTIRTTLDAGESDMTWDFGIFKPAGLGDYVWFDTDADGIQDSDEPVLENITVRLLDEQGAVLGTTVTDSNGYYEFVNLLPGDYIVEFVPPAGHGFTLQEEGLDAATDSDADRVTGKSRLVSLEAGEFDPTIDAGMASGAVLAAIEAAVAARQAAANPTPTPTAVPPTPTPTPQPTATPPVQTAALGVNTGLQPPTIAKSVSQSIGAVGDTITYTVNVTNPNSTVLANVSVSDALSSKLDYISATSAKGDVSFDGATRIMRVNIGDMAANEVIAITIQARINNTAVAPDRIDNTAQALAENLPGVNSNVVSTQLIPDQIPTTGMLTTDPASLAVYFVVLALFAANIATVIIKRREDHAV